MYLRMVDIIKIIIGLIILVLTILMYKKEIKIFLRRAMSKERGATSDDIRVKSEEKKNEI